MKTGTKEPKLKEKVRGFRLTIEDQKRLAAIHRKYPEQNDTIIIRRAIRELAEREQVA